MWSARIAGWWCAGALAVYANASPGGFIPGACCLPDGSCQDNVFQSDCEAMGGTFQGKGTDCAFEKCPLPCPGAGNCFVPNGSPGCQDAGCCEAVCGVNEFCCTNTWDSFCADLAATLCGSEECPGTESCFAGHASPGCDDEVCCNKVCLQEPVCCIAAWDESCADLALDTCGHPACPGSGDCLEDNGTPGCSDVVCCNEVCFEDPVCCDAVWDLFCASMAEEICVAPCAGDTNGSGTVDVQDLTNVILDWGTDGAGHNGDVSGDGVVDVQDITALIQHWGPC